jgi:hypothetical protein
MITEEQLKLIADKFGQQEVVKGLLHAFDGNSWIDPLTLWSLRRIGDRQIEWLIVLLDWMPDAEADKPAGDLESNVDYCEDYYTKPWTHEEERSKTFALLFWSCWSRALLETRTCLVGNSVWGVREPPKKQDKKQEGKKKPKKVDLTPVIPVAEKIIWEEIIKMINPTRIFACGDYLTRCFRFPGFPEPAYLCHPSYPMWAVERAGLKAAKLITP